MSPDERYLEDQECWPHGTPADATVTAIPLVDGGRAYEPQVARPEPSDEQQRAEAREALSRLATSLRQSIDAQQRVLADIEDLMEALR